MMRRITTSVLLGLATTIAVAWGCAIFINPYQLGQVWGSINRDDSAPWSYWIIRSAGAFLVQRTPSGPAIPTIFSFGGSSVEIHSSGPYSIAAYEHMPEVPQWSALRQPNSPQPDDHRGTIIEDARGFPLLCMMSEIVIRSGDSSAAPSTANVENGIGLRAIESDAGSQSEVFRVLPLKPIWAGFAANSAIFSMGWYSLIATSAVSRELLRDFMTQARRRCGACASCGYDLRYTPDSRICPECGAQAPGSAPTK